MSDTDSCDDFEQYARARWRRLQQSALLLGCSPEEAEDLVQTALLRCFRHWGKVCASTDMDAYVYRILVNCFYKSRRRHWWRERPVEPSSLPSGASTFESGTGARLTVEKLLAELPLVPRTILILRYFCDLSEKQTASVVGVPLGTVKSQTSRALGKLANNQELLETFAPREGR
jgi:RNA polymerase sigma-70 factor (sigma-E family)